MSFSASGIRTPLDLRLLPAALACWAGAWAAVHLSAGGALRLGAVLALCGLVFSAVAWCAARWSPLMLHAILCCAVGGAVAFSAGVSLHGYQASGWDEAVSSDAPREVVFRVIEDARPLTKPDHDGSPRIMAEATVLHAEGEGKGEGGLGAVGAPVVVLMTLDEEAVADHGPTSLPLTAGHRYQAMVRASATDPGERATALLIPFGEESPEHLPADRWTRTADLFNQVRDGTRQSSQVAWGDGPALLPGMILGDRSGQSEELTKAMEDSGLSHLTVVSGTHCALVLGALMVGARMCRLPRGATVLLVLVALVLFVMLVHPTPSVVRAAVMGGIGALAVFAGRGRVSSALLCICVLVLLLYDPWYSVTPAFQLSAAASLGIVLAGARLKALFGQVMPAIVAGPLALTASAQIFAVPVLLPLAQGVNTYSVPANLLAGPLLPLVTVPGTAAALLSLPVPWLATALLWVAGLPAAGIGWVGRSAAALPQSLAPWPEGWAGVVLVVLYLAGAVCGLWLLLRTEYRGGRAAYGRTAVRLLPSAMLAAAAGSLVAVVLPAPSVHTAATESWRVALCDVGQGDMLVVRTSEQGGIIVDTGDDPAAADSCLRRLGVEEIHTVMITHEHLDHYGGLRGVLRGRESEQVIYSASQGWDLVAEADFGEQSAKDLEIIRADIGERGSVQGDYPLRFTVWSADEHHSNPNDNSLVVHFELIDPEAPATSRGSLEDPVRMLTLGDMEEEAAAQLLRREALPRHVDLLKVAHHGAANGGTELIESREPAVALIGVGEENTYGHPHPDILDSLEGVGAVTYRTDLHGTVLFSLGEDGLVVSEG